MQLLGTTRGHCHFRCAGPPPCQPPRCTAPLRLHLGSAPLAPPLCLTRKHPPTPPRRPAPPRPDNIVMFNPLGQESLVKIVELQIGLLAQRLRGQDLALRITRPAASVILQASYDPAYGARPVRYGPAARVRGLVTAPFGSL